MKSIIHPFIKGYLKVTSHFFFEKIEISGKENLPADCPVIFACNHPNAFLDSIVMTSCTQRPLYYTARGDFFKSKVASALLRYIHILPVFRKEEGKEYLYKNEETFSDCIDIFKKNGAIIIFSEGFCVNEWNLRPLRKGTARLANEAWNNPDIGDRLKVVPVAIHYSSWLKLFPRVYIEFLENIEKKSFFNSEETGIFNKQFNERLKSILSKKCIIVDKYQDAALQNKMVGFMLKNSVNGIAIAKKLQNTYLSLNKETFRKNYRKLSEFLLKENISYDRKFATSIGRMIFLLSSSLLFIVAWVYNFIPYLLSKLIVWKSTKDNDFYDSLMYCTLMIIYPIYLGVLFWVDYRYLGFKEGLQDVFLAAISAYFYEDSKRTLLSFLKRNKLKIAREMFTRLFETSNG